MELMNTQEQKQNHHQQKLTEEVKPEQNSISSCATKSNGAGFKFSLTGRMTDRSWELHLSARYLTSVMGAGIAQLVVLGLTVHSVAGSILLWGLSVEGIFPLELTWVQTPFPQKLLRMRV